MDEYAKSRTLLHLYFLMAAQGKLYDEPGTAKVILHDDCPLCVQAKEYIESRS
jgi:hypothetical protein